MTPATVGPSDGAHAPAWARLLRAANPGPMTLDGTNTWLLRATAADRVTVVDPGPVLPEHLDAIAAHGEAALIVLTHWHPDHTESAAALGERLGVPVRARDPRWCFGGEPLADGETLNESGLNLRVRHTPGHTADSLSLFADEPEPAVLTGDTVLGRGTTVVLWPDGNLTDYFASLDLLAAYGDVPVLPGHGPTLPSVKAAAEQYRAHREQRLDQVRAALDKGATSALDIVEIVYADVDRSVWPAAEATVKAQLEYLGIEQDQRDREHIDRVMELGEP
ncbi:MBL fold metallo-hydrolase [Phytomonospora endophytica]|uniref:Glyoxylase-like metal-dependent hydrolase (Beta-lactamase superfamily II) n=1 Tax=Phytomonospora endophytica TaxID=714109 RepID=A0A841FQ46_9ACTN|nr:MBL fold metallo-hydrolase [Phytomonospora endophytica]MBB6035387.1 glyoxylase-like metal-dependent hydrolase (beta-lactamase superfamily II) [Phytomonospora endophytica]GIG63861.1 MBL fold metallo-hydrolase [Phytomonospora endophytica]